MKTKTYLFYLALTLFYSLIFLPVISTTQTNTQYGLIKISSTSLSDTTLKVSFPNGYENWLVGSTKQIVLESQNAGSIILEYTTNTGQTWQQIGTTSGTTFDWVVPNTPSTQCKIRARSAANPILKDESDNVFFILSIPGIFDVQFNYDLTAITGETGNSGVVYVPGLNEFWISNGSSNHFCRVSKQGILIEKFTIPGLSKVCGMVYDGTYIYAVNKTRSIYIISPISKIIVGIINDPNLIEYIAYDPPADEGKGAFWGGNHFGYDIGLLFRSGVGTQPRAGNWVGIPSGPSAGLAYDNFSPGGPYLWFSGNGDIQKIKQRSIIVSVETGLVHDLLTDIGLGITNPQIAGLFITPGFVNGTATIGGILQGSSDHLYGYKLCDISPDQENYQGLVGYWKLDETAGVQYADAVGSNNASAGTTPPVPVSGKIKGAQLFSGLNTQINISANPSFDFGPNTNFSIECWVNRPGNLPLTGTEVCLGRYVSSNKGFWLLGITKTGQAGYEVISDGANSPRGYLRGVNVMINDGIWHHLVLTKNGPNISFFVDGKEQAIVANWYFSGVSSPTAPLTIGWSTLGNYSYKGTIDGVAIYNNTLTPAEVYKHYALGLAGLEIWNNYGTVNAPIITSTAKLKGTMDDLYSYKVSASGVPAPAYSLVSFPEGMTINSLSGEINWTPTAPGNYNVTVEAYNGINPPSQQSYVINVEGAICPSSMISYWRLDETTQGIYADYIGTNNAVSSLSPTPVSGKVGGAQQFNGTTTKIEVPANTSLNFTKRSNFSVEFWYKGSNMPSTVKCAVGRYISNTGARWYVGLNAKDGKAKFFMYTPGASAVVNGTSIVDGSWHHVAATRNGYTGSLKIYVDGVLKSTIYGARFPIDFSSPIAKLTIGWSNFQNEYSLEGSLDEVAVFNSELSSSEIMQHYSNGLNNLSYCSHSLNKLSYTANNSFESFTVFNSNNIISLKWKTSDSDAYGFEIEKNISGNWKRINSLNNNKMSSFECYDTLDQAEGTILYRIKLLNKDNSFVYSDVAEIKTLPVKYELFQNYPNPFNPVTTIKFSLPKQQKVVLKVYNQLGEEITTLVNKDYEPGSYVIKFDAGNLSSGIYFYRIESGEFTSVKKLLLLK